MKTNLNLSLSALALFALTLMSTTSFAVAPPVVPGSADSSRVQGQVAPVPQNAPTILGAKSVSGSSLNAPKGASKVKFVLKSVTVGGMEAYNKMEVRSLYADMIGQTISLADVYALANKLTAKYRNDGYILSQVVVPPQTIKSGDIKLQVVEGFVDHITIQGETRNNTAYLNSFAEKIRAERPLNSKALERYLLLMNDLAGVSAHAVLSPSKTAGGSDVTLVVEQKPYDLFAQADNRGSKYLGPLQLNGGARINNVFGLYEGLTIQAVTAPDGWPHSEMKYGALTWSQPLDHEGTKLNVGGSVTSTRPGYTLTEFDVHGLSHAMNVELSHPFIRSRQQNFTTALRFDSLNSSRTDNISLAPTEDRLRVLRLNGAYQFTDGFLGINGINAEVSKGLDILNASQKGDANMTHANANPQFVKGTLEVSRTQRVTEVFEVFASASGQRSSSTLLASEQFGLGGVNYGSAYDNSEITGDDGIAGRLEFRANNPFSGLPVNVLQPYAFYDIGKVWDPSNSVAADRQMSLASTGLGVRASINQNFAGTVEMAKPLTRDVGTEGNRNPRFFGSVTAKF